MAPLQDLYHPYRTLQSSFCSLQLFFSFLEQEISLSVSQLMLDVQVQNDLCLLQKQRAFQGTNVE